MLGVICGNAIEENGQGDVSLIGKWFGTWNEYIIRLVS